MSGALGRPPRGPIRPLSVAPMMDWTDRHYRRFMRGITRRTLLYTEMVTANAIVHGDVERLLGFDPAEHPVAVQLGGDDPATLAAAARIAVERGYDEVNLNVGCPSDRVQRGRFGACLMAEPGVVADAVRALREAVAVPVTVKHRLGIDELDDDVHLHGFVGALVDAGVDRVIVHARKAWLQGLSPKQNRTVPPLQHERVIALKDAFGDLRVETNGGVRDLAGALGYLGVVDGVMIGRAAYDDPYLFADADRAVFGEDAAAPTRASVVADYLPYLEVRLAAGTPLPPLVKPLIGLMRGVPGGRSWRRTLTEGAGRPGAGPDLVERALTGVVEAAGRGRDRGHRVVATERPERGHPVAGW